MRLNLRFFSMRSLRSALTYLSQFRPVILSVSSTEIGTPLQSFDSGGSGIQSGFWLEYESWQ